MTMRRFGARWRDETTPREILDVFLVEGRYEILVRNGTLDGREEWADGLDVDPEGWRHPSFELEPYQARAYRYRNGRRRQSWASLPAPVRNTVAAWLRDDTQPEPSECEV
jgi:hypothetical protein